jgi:hypothetical protein
MHVRYSNWKFMNMLTPWFWLLYMISKAVDFFVHLCIRYLFCNMLYKFGEKFILLENY